jgi:predicted peptidase
MKTSTRIFTLLLIALIVIAGSTVHGQNVLSPTDTVVTFNPKDTPTLPRFGAIAKWVRTVRMTWNTSMYKAYIYNGCQFRLMYPASYNPTANDGKKYPMLIFDHGEGEAGTIYDNEESLFHGGQIFANAEAAGTFDGYVLVMQTGGGWGPYQFTAQQYIIDYMIANNKLDPFRVIGHGLSGGGSGAWGLFYTNPSYLAGLLPMSSVSV